MIAQSSDWLHRLGDLKMVIPRQVSTYYVIQTHEIRLFVYVILCHVREDVLNIKQRPVLHIFYVALRVSFRGRASFNYQHKQLLSGEV